ncbi:hypothetical protein ACIBL5_05935 [Streptomyces sp. NPDC050516]|uniref:hypothetical protein n=1 Tax=Streptomyces sp. NPDC050516 TaxID=3365621 RepID=UPI0037AA5217
MDGNRYTHAVKLNKKVARLSQPLWQLARDATSEFQSSRTVRRELREHVRRVTLAFTQAADGLMRDREVAARKLGSLAATAASNIAVDRFPEILPESLLPSTDPGESPLEPDRLDGRRLANACGWSLISDTTFSLFLAWLGGPAEVLVSLAVLGFPVAVYVILAAKYGLSEATRLTRSISSFFSSGSPL